jgi:hypothetical protein
MNRSIELVAAIGEHGVDRREIDLLALGQVGGQHHGRLRP